MLVSYNLHSLNLNEPIQRADIPNQNENANDNNGRAGNPAVPAGQANDLPRRRNLTITQQVLSLLQSLSLHGVRIPRTQGIFYDIYSFTVALVGSVFPGWQPLAEVVQP